MYISYLNPTITSITLKCYLQPTITILLLRLMFFFLFRWFVNLCENLVVDLDTNFRSRIYE